MSIIIYTWDSIVKFVFGLYDIIGQFSGFFTAVSTSITALIAFWWYLTKPQLYLEKFIFSEPTSDSPYTLYFVCIDIRRLGIGKWKLLDYNGPKIMFEGVVIRNEKEYKLDLCGQGFLDKGKLCLLRKENANERRIFLYDNGQLKQIGCEELIKIKVIPKDSKDKDVRSINKTLKVEEIIKRAVKRGYDSI